LHQIWVHIIWLCDRKGDIDLTISKEEILTYVSSDENLADFFLGYVLEFESWLGMFAKICLVALLQYIYEHDFIINISAIILPCCINKDFVTM